MKSLQTSLARWFHQTSELLLASPRYPRITEANLLLLKLARFQVKDQTRTCWWREEYQNNEMKFSSIKRWEKFSFIRFRLRSRLGLDRTGFLLCWRHKKSIFWKTLKRRRWKTIPVALKTQIRVWKVLPKSLLFQNRLRRKTRSKKKSFKQVKFFFNLLLTMSLIVCDDAGVVPHFSSRASSRRCKRHVKIVLFVSQPGTAT